MVLSSKAAGWTRVGGVSPNTTSQNAPVPAATSAEETAWQNARRMDQIELFESYLTAYPNSAHAGEAKTSLDYLWTTDQGAWVRAKRGNTAALYQEFLRAYPRSQYAAEAQAVLAKLAPAQAQAPASGEPRFALVIQNAASRGNIPPLAAGGRDATLVGDTLRKVGYQVTIAQDTTRADFMRAAGPKSVALVYFAGRGVQMESENWLLPTDFDGNDSNAARLRTNLQSDAVGVDNLVDLVSSGGASANIFLFDVSNPGLRGSSGISLGAGSQFRSGSSVFVSVSVPPGQNPQVLGANSAYASAFAAEIQRPGATIQATMEAVRRRVLQETANRQEPVNISRLSTSASSVCLAPCATAPR
jgi:hypothetical protein